MPFAPITPSDYAYLCQLLRDHLGQELGPGKEYLAEARLGFLCQEKSIASPAELFSQIRRSPYSPLVEDILESMAIQETSFFRGQNTFNSLNNILIPAFLENNTTKKLNIWSSCCSTGQEPYSLALLLRDHFQLSGWSIRLLATDFSTHALGKAKQGSYSRMETVRGLPMEMRQRYFSESENGQFVLHDSIRAMVQFEKLNLLDSYSFLGGPFDLVLLRNVLIYMPPDVVSEILVRVRRVIKDDGFLLLGDSETILGKSNLFQVNEQGLNYFRPRPEV